MDVAEKKAQNSCVASMQKTGFLIMRLIFVDKRFL